MDPAKIDCGDPRFLVLFAAEKKAFASWTRKAIAECGLGIEEIVPAELQESVEHTIADKIFETATTPEEWPQMIKDELYGVASAMNKPILDRLSAQGVAPVYAGYTLPASFSGQGTQVFFGPDSTGIQKAFIVSTVHGGLDVWKIPDNWIEPQLIEALREAGDRIMHTQSELGR